MSENQNPGTALPPFMPDRTGKPVRPARGCLGSSLGCLGKLVFTLVLGVVAVVSLWAVFMPWAFYMGGHFHPLGSWSGWGQLQSQTAGDYLLYVNFSPAIYRHQVTPEWNVKGNAYLCTPKGETFNLYLGGDMPRTFRVNSQGQKIHLYMSNRSMSSQFSGDDRPYFQLYGVWGDSKITGDDRKTLSTAFAPDSTLRPQHSPVLPSQQKDAQFTIREGSYSDYKAACRDLHH
jgi:hypothetical protein